MIKKEILRTDNSLNFGSWIVEDSKIDIDVTKVIIIDEITLMDSQSHQIFFDRINGTVQEKFQQFSNTNTNSSYNESIYSGTCSKELGIRKF